MLKAWTSHKRSRSNYDQLKAPQLIDSGLLILLAVVIAITGVWMGGK
ncbi:MAG: hypothetical protein PHG09_14775 [Desulfuromonadaceae bacterium]|nr:hypothetical protein [Desulfuromonadaceae bacterium]